MPTIPEYTRGIIKPREVTQTFDHNAISRAGETASGLAEVSSVGAGLAKMHNDANNATWLNAAMIENKRKKIDLEAQAKEQRKSNPFGFAKDFEKDLAKIDEEFLKSAPNEEVKQAFKDSLDKMNLSYYEQNLNWENSAKVSLYADRVENATKELGTLAFRAAREGKPIDDLMRDAEATAYSATMINPDKNASAQSKAKIKQHVVKNYLESMAGSNPEEARKILDSKKYDGILTEENLSKLYNITETNDPNQAEIIRQIYDVNEISGVSDDEYLIGVSNIENEILEKRNKGELSPKDASKLSNQLKTLTGKKVAEATSMISYKIPTASSMIDSSLMPEYRGEVKRKVFYGMSNGAYKDEKQAAIEEINKLKKEKRDAALKVLKTTTMKKDFKTSAEAEQYFSSIQDQIPDGGLVITIDGKKVKITKD